jgi:hypothetical protein
MMPKVINSFHFSVNDESNNNIIIADWNLSHQRSVYGSRYLYTLLTQSFSCWALNFLFFIFFFLFNTSFTGIQLIIILACKLWKIVKQSPASPRSQKSAHHKLSHQYGESGVLRPQNWIDLKKIIRFRVVAFFFDTLKVQNADETWL